MMKFRQRKGKPYKMNNVSNVIHNRMWQYTIDSLKNAPISDDVWLHVDNNMCNHIPNGILIRNISEDRWVKTMHNTKHLQQ